MTFPFTIHDYEGFYAAKIAFIAPSFMHTWPNNSYEANYHFDMVCNYLKEQGYHIMVENFRYYGRDSIFLNKTYKYLIANIVIVQPLFTEMIVYNYNPLQ